MPLEHTDCIFMQDTITSFFVGDVNSFWWILTELIKISFPEGKYSSLLKA
jgi:hypothetical protein